MRLTRGFQQHPAGSVLVEFGDTKVLCAASVTEGVPRWRKGSGLGWVTAEYAMLPSATHTRSDRESVKGRVGGRTHEISRLIGRSLRACIDLAALGENTIALDCDVLQADGGTRTAAITGAYVALADAVTWLGAHAAGSPTRKPLSCQVAAVSVGVVDGRVRLDLPYEEDSRAEVDANVVATDTGTLIEVQGTGEGATFTRRTLDAMLDVALRGIARAGWPRRAPRWRRRTRALVTRRLARHDRRAARHPQPGQARRAAPDAGRRGVAGVRVLGLADVPEFPEEPETGATFAENALAKARDAAKATGLASVADDSGLAVDALNGMPGVLSARWSGRHGDDRANLELVLGQLADVPDDRRGAAFVCAAALVVPGGEEIVVHGEWTGRLVRAPRGHQRLRLRPDLRPGRRGRGRRRSWRRRRRTRCRTAAARCGRCCRTCGRWAAEASGRGCRRRGAVGTVEVVRRADGRGAAALAVLTWRRSSWWTARPGRA